MCTYDKKIPCFKTFLLTGLKVSIFLKVRLISCHAFSPRKFFQPRRNNTLSNIWIPKNYVFLFRTVMIMGQHMRLVVGMNFLDWLQEVHVVTKNSVFTEKFVLMLGSTDYFFALKDIYWFITSCTKCFWKHSTYLLIDNSHRSLFFSRIFAFFSRILAFSHFFPIFFQL